MAEPTFPRLSCSHCGEQDLEKIQYNEDVTSVRTLVRATSGASWISLLVGGTAEIAEGSTNPRLHCTSCGADFAIPDCCEVVFD